MSWKNVVLGAHPCITGCGGLPVRCMGSYKSCKAPVTVKKTCRMADRIEPEYFKQRRPCKTDAELRAKPSLGYPRCNIEYKPECMGKCFNEPRLDTIKYRPSRSLDRSYQINWVDCVLEKPPRRCLGQMMPPEVKRRKAPKPTCPKIRLKKCRTLMPLKCRPLTPAPATSDTPCIKFPLCECSEARKNTLCKIRPKTHTTCKRQRTRYVCFSDCKKAAMTPAAITECREPISVCEMWRNFRHRHGL